MTTKPKKAAKPTKAAKPQPKETDLRKAEPEALPTSEVPTPENPRSATVFPNTAPSHSRPRPTALSHRRVDLRSQEDPEAIPLFSDLEVDVDEGGGLTLLVNPNDALVVSITRQEDSRLRITVL